MTQVTTSNAGQIMGLTALDHSGDKIGKIEQVYLNDQTGSPEWVTISTGLFGKNESFAPLQGANYSEDNVTLAVDKTAVKGAPQIVDDGHLEESEQAELYRYYAEQLSDIKQPDRYDAPVANAPAATGANAPAATGANAQAATGANASATTGGKVGEAESMTRSEERLHVSTEQVETGRARLVKYIVTENVTRTIPVSHEEVRVVREPINEADARSAVTGATITEAEHEVTLHAERPVITTETVPVERVKLGTETVTESENVSGTVRKEQVELRDDTTDTVVTR